MKQPGRERNQEPHGASHAFLFAITAAPVKHVWTKRQTWPQLELEVRFQASRPVLLRKSNSRSRLGQNRELLTATNAKFQKPGSVALMPPASERMTSTRGSLESESGRCGIRLRQ